MAGRPAKKPAKKFGPDICDAIVELVFDGLTNADAARELGVNGKTVKNWLSKGRSESSGPYRDFAEAVDRAREDRAQREQPMTEEELRLAVSRAAKQGSVAAQKLYWEILRASDDPDEDKDGFEALDGEDELEQIRQKRQAAA